MFKFLYELFIGPVIDLKNETIGYGVYFGLVFVMTCIYLVIPFGPFLLLAAMKGNLVQGLAFCGVIALGLGATSVDRWLTKLQEEIRNEAIRGKELDGKREGE